LPFIADHYLASLNNGHSVTRVMTFVELNVEVPLFETSKQVQTIIVPVVLFKSIFANR